MEGLMVMIVIFLCWFVAIFVYEEDMSLTRYAVILILIMSALYFLVRFTHWAWPDTAYSVVNVASANQSSI